MTGSTSAETPVVEITGLSVVRRGVPVLEDVNLTVAAGDFLGLIGPNGGGKTTLLNVILGLLHPTAGTVRIFGKSPREARGEIGYVPQHTKFDRDFPITVLDVVLSGRLRRGLRVGPYSRRDREIAESCLARLGMAEFAARSIGKLSGGQLQRVLIARALAVEAKLLLLDEPTASVDTPGGRSVYSLLEELAADVTVILVSHDIGVISTHVRSIGCLNRKLHFHPSRELSADVLEEVYGCPVELLAHGHAHRVLADHRHDEEP